MKYFYMVREGEVTLIEDCDTLNQYPFMFDEVAHEEEEQYSDNWNLYEEGGRTWIIAYAENEEEALELATQYGDEKIDVGNVWCESCGCAHGALSA